MLPNETKYNNIELEDKIRNLPDNPGVYQFLDEKSNIIYIGKGKSLRKRVSSYFNKTNFENKKLRVLVRKITDVQHIVVSSESDALLLENNLIKKYQPRYNINLKDDKSFPWICIKNEDFPRVFLTRDLTDESSEYFGPYTSAATAKTLLGLIRELYKLRTCKLNLSEENIKSGKFKVCLEYHLGNCKGPCEGLQDKEDYDLSIVQIKNILKGNLKEVIDYLKDSMLQLSSEYKFEEASQAKAKILALENFQLKSTIVNPSVNDVDVFSFHQDEKYAWINFLKVMHGSIIQSHTVEIQKKLDESKEEILEYTIFQLRSRLFSKSREIIVPFKPGSLPEGMRYIVPQRGDKKKLLELSERNVKYFMFDSKRQRANSSPLKSQERILSTLKTDLRMGKIPLHIECFDNSNIQGSNPVAACVVFKNGKPSKREYRHYNIKNVEGPNDFASMEEVVFRRYSRLLKENEPLPQLIIVDGGKGQLSSAVKSLKALDLRNKITIIGIAERLEEIYFPDDPVPLYIDKNSETLKLVQQLRNEAHRFGINFHRTKRSKSMINSRLDKIPGIGEKTVQKLISNFGSIELLKARSFTEISDLIGNSKAKLVKDSLEEKNS